MHIFSKKPEGSWQARRRQFRVILAAITAAVTACTGMVTLGVTASGATTETTENTSFYVNANDLDFILRQIQIAEAHDPRSTNPGAQPGALLCATPTDRSGKCVPDPKLPLGLRTVDGSFNNLVNGRTNWGAADQPFERLVAPEYKQGTVRPNVPAAPGAGQDVSMCEPLAPGAPTVITPTCYAQWEAGHFVYDSAPRVSSNLIVDQTVSNPAAVNSAENTPGGTIHPNGTITIPNTAADEGLSAPVNSFFAFFGQFFDHGLDLVNKGGNGTIIVPLQEDDPNFDPASNTNFLTLTRAERGPGPDGVVGTVDDAFNNQTTPYVDQNQTYTSHPSHQVFLREYSLVAGVPVDTGHLLNGVNGGLATWDDIKTQARTVLGIDLTDADVLNVPMVFTDLYGNFVPGDNGLPMLVTPAGNIAASLAAPVDTTPAIHTNHAFLDDIAHGATPLFDCVTEALIPQEYDATGEPIPLPQGTRICDANMVEVQGGQLTGYNPASLGDHFITGDGRGNENIGLTSVHHIFHSEHNRMADSIRGVLAANPELEKAYQGLAHQWPNERPEDVLPGPEADDWTFEQRLFQAARFVTEMEYQHLVFEEYARTIAPSIDAVVFNENSYNPNVNADVSAEFANAVYRFGHSMMTENINRDGFGSANVPLLNGFLNPNAYTMDGALTHDQAAGSVIMGTAAEESNQIDEFIVDTLRNELLGLPLDLATINLIRGKDMGTPGLQAARRLFYAQSGDVSVRPYANWTDFGNGLKNGNIFGRGGQNASLVNFVAAYGTHPSIIAAETVAEKRLAASLLVNGAPAGQEFIQRYGSTDRFATAAVVSKAAFPNGAPVAYLASGVNFPDALVGGPAAAYQGGPMLLTTPSGTVPFATVAELGRLNPSKIVVLGGASAISEGIVSELQAIAPVTRIAGSDRYDTAALVSKGVFPSGVDRVYIATADSFPDALSGSAVAAPNASGRAGAPVLLVNSTSIPSATQAELTRLNPGKIIVLGGTSVVSASVASGLDAFTTGAVERQGGSDRYATSVAVSSAAYPTGANVLYVATGNNFPDALAAAPAAGRENAPLLLVPGSGPLPSVITAEIQRLGVKRIVILGGPSAVSADVEAQLAAFSPTPVSVPGDRIQFMNSTEGWSAKDPGLENIDFWSGGLAERLNPFGGMLGASFNYVFENSLEDLQFGDRFYYLFRNQGQQLFAALEGNSFASLVERNSDASNVSANIFVVNNIEFDLNNPNPMPAGISQLGNGEYRFVGEEHVEMHGTPGNDRMRGDQGDDSLWGRHGNDTIEGGSGNDRLNGGIGDDILTDLFGDDEVRAGMGNDAVNGGPGFDLLIGGGGDDFITRGGDIGDVFLGDGADTYLGGTGRANVFGGEGNDWVEGGSHADLLQGDNANQFQNDVIGGNDVVMGRGGDDDIEGEGGDDILVGAGLGTDRHLGNMGWDWVTYYGETLPVDADFNFTLLQRPDVNAVRDRFDQLEALSGGDGDDKLRGPSRSVEGEFTGNEEYLHKMKESTLDLVGGLRNMLYPTNGMNFGQQFMRGAPVADSDGFPSIVIGGKGSDLIEGRAGNDYLDGDAYLAVELVLIDPSGAIIERNSSASAYRNRLLTGAINPGDLQIEREIRYDDNTTNPAVDVAEYEDLRSAYTITHIEGGYWQVAHTEAPEPEESNGTDILKNIERLQFQDTCLILNSELMVTEPCEAVGELALSFEADAVTGLINEGSPVTARLNDLAGNPFDLSQATNIRFSWFGGEGSTPETVTEVEELTIGGVAPDAPEVPVDPNYPVKSTFKPDDSAVGSLLRANIKFEINGTLHTVVSPFTSVTVANVNDLPVAPTISGPPTVGTTLSVVPPADGDGLEGVVFTYTWQRAATADAASWLDVKGPGSTDPTTDAGYALTADDVGQHIRVVIAYTDNHGTLETVTTAPLGPVT